MFLSPHSTCRMLAGFLDRECRDPSSVPEQVLEDVYRFLHLALEKDHPVPAGEPVTATIEEALSSAMATQTTKLVDYNFRAALAEEDELKTYTRNSPTGNGIYITVLSADDVRSKILRGELSSDFEDEFIKRRLGFFLGRSIDSWAEDGDRMIVTHR